jgi:hypothetical protein
MKTLLVSLAAIGAGFSLVAADAAADLKAAVKKLSDSGNYSWVSKTERGGNSRVTPGALTGKTEKDGFTWLSQSMNDNTVEAARKGDKGVVKTDEGWKTAEELPRPGGQGGGQGAGGPRGGGAGGFRGRGLLVAAMPAAELDGIVAKAKRVTSEADGLFVVELTEDGAKELATFGRGGRGGGQGGGNRPEPKDAKATAKIWVKDGAPAKYEVASSAKITMRDQEREISRTTTVEIQDVGTTKVEVPEDAKKKL